MDVASNNSDDLYDALSSRLWEWCYLEGEELPPDLETAVSNKLRHITSDSWPARLALGGLYVNGQLAQSLQQPLPLPCRIQYYEPIFDVQQADKFFPAWKDEQVIYRDLDLLAAFKPAGIPSMPSRDQTRYSFRAQIDAYLGFPAHMPSRLDMSAQGIMLLSINKRMHALLQQAYEQRRVKKTYIFKSMTRPDWLATSCSESIGRNPRHPVLRSVNGARALSAHTDFRYLLDAPDGAAIIAAFPHSGRTHQIRVHASHLGVPLMGDKFYGGAEASGLHLLSFAVGLRHPGNGEPLQLTIPAHLCPDWAPHSDILAILSETARNSSTKV
ncbi:MAG: RluA family pseudouridine synthase [Oligoflexia bacterium]|nr:RluA family pseudouridine synthase [Oligoflexia bacterium]